mgnify:CR=1 FL=1
MTQYAIATDLNRCVGCLACSVTCKVVNDVPIGSYWNKVLRIGPNPKFEGAEFPDVEMYFLPVQCQHCENPECVKVCPTGASRKLADGTVPLTVRGLKEDLNSLSPDKMNLRADVSGMKPGTHTAALSYQLDEAYTVAGTPSITLEVKAKAPETEAETKEEDVRASSESAEAVPENSQQKQEPSSAAAGSQNQ